ncbi:aryl-sulfate sulfotransferase [candidate division WOR-3 bacterium]|nr:aryl-sulfate sulfotransferase [candidate division WOR-3 bacterium]
MSRFAGAAILLAALAAPGAAQRTVGLMLHDSTRSYQGYTLFAPMSWREVYLIDNNGELVHKWDAPPRPFLVVYLLEDGSLLRTAPAGERDKVEILDWNGNVTWSFDYTSDSAYSHHDVEMLPGGNVVMVAAEGRTRAEAIEAGRNPALCPYGLLPEHLIEVDTATNQIVWEWHAWDHLVQDFDSTKQNWGVVRDHPELLDINYRTRNDPDIMHCNAVDYNAALDQLAISSRGYSEIWVIDHSTTTEQARGHSGGRYGRGGDLLYRWGNPVTYRRGDTTHHRLWFQHDIQWIPDSLAGAGHFLAFSNGSPRNGARTWSSVEEWESPADSAGFYPLGPDSTWGPWEPAWWFRDTNEFYSPYISGCQRLPNGNTLVCEGEYGTLFEVTPDSEVVWKYIVPVCSTGPMHQGDTARYRTNSAFRCYRYGPDFPGFEGRNLTPMGPIELPPAGVAEPVPARPGETILVVRPVTASDRAQVHFSLPAPSRVDLAVFDCLGARRATLAQGELAAGEHVVNWRPDGLPAGTYFCRLEAGGASASRRLALAR